jgi:ribosomal protein L40E
MEQKDEGRKFVELEWVCPNCDTRNKGSVKTCGSCGAPQPENVKFQRAADEKVVTDGKALAAAKAGADIHCGFCGTRNPATAVTCSQCGGDLKEGKARQAGQALQAAPPPPKAINCGNCGTENPGTAQTCKQCGAPLKRETAPVQPPPPPAPKPAPPKKMNWLVMGGIAAALMACCIAAFLIFFTPSKTVQGTVTDLQWQTSVLVEEMQPVNYTNKAGSPPSDAYNVSCQTDSREVCEEKTVDQGNGFAEVVQECHTESEQTCDYTLDEWTTIQKYEMDGTDNRLVYAEPSITSDQRTLQAITVLTVTFSTPDGSKDYTPGSESEFGQYEIGSTWALTMNRMGDILKVEK